MMAVTYDGDEENYNDGAMTLQMPYAGGSGWGEWGFFSRKRVT